MRTWIAWLVTAGLVLLAIHQQTEIRDLTSRQEQEEARSAARFRYAVRRVNFHSFPDALERLAAASGVEQTVEQFKEAQTVAVGFTDDLLMLNDLRHGGPPVGHGLQYGDYLYNPATREQETLMWQIVRTRPFATLWAMERKFYIDEGVMQESDRAALMALTERARAIATVMDQVRATVDAPADMTRAAAAQMEELAEPLDAMGQVLTQYEASLPPLEPKPGSLYYRLYPSPRPRGE